MGKNADKKRMRRLGMDPNQSSAAVASAQATDPSPSLSERPGGYDAKVSLQDPADVPLAGDNSLSLALFRITCLLSVHDKKGVVRENIRRVAAEVSEITQSDTVSLLFLEPGDDLVPPRLVLAAAHGLAIADEGLVTFDLGDGVAGKAAATGETLNIADAPRDARFSPLYGQRTEIGSLVAVPLSFGGHVLGVLTASRREIRAFSPMDVARLQLIGASIAQDLEQSKRLLGAVVDPLTGLGSRLSLLLALPREVEISKRYRTDLTLLVLDIDGLDAINAEHGRTAGDRALEESGARLRDALRSADLVARLGGDELAALLPMTSSNSARALAKRLLKALAQPISIGTTSVETRWSIGTATLAPDEDALAVLWRADDALAEAKRLGGGTIATAPAPRRDVVD